MRGKFTVLLSIVFLFLTTIQCQSQKKSNFVTAMKARTLYNKCSEKAVKNNKWINFDVTITGEYGGKQLPKQILSFSHYNDKDSSMVFITYKNEANTQHYKITNDKLYMIDSLNQDFSVFNKADNSINYELCRGNIESRFRYLPYYNKATIGMPLMSRILFQQYNKDTIVNGIEKIKFYGASLKTHLYSYETQDLGEWSQYMVITWVDKKTFMVDSVYAYQMNKNLPVEKNRYIVNNLNFDDCNSLYSSLFNPKENRYKDFEFCDNENLPAEMKKTLNTSANDALLNFPIYNLEKDSIYINNLDGWLLLDFWSFGCHPCAQQFKTFRQENDSLGYTILEKNNIKILSINPHSDNIHALNDYAEKFKAENYIYFSKGISQFIRIDAYPTYFLITPSKEIIYNTHSLGDYSEILKVIEDYNNGNYIEPIGESKYIIKH